MAQTEKRDLAEVIGKRVEVEPVERLELRVRRPARPHEVRVVGVRETVRVGARRGEHRLLLQRQDEIDSACGDENVRDGLGSLGVGGRVRAPFLDMQLAAETLRECGEEARSIGLRGPDLEVRVFRPAEGARAEQCAAKVGGGAAAPGDDATRREAERPVERSSTPARWSVAWAPAEPSTWSW